MRKLVYNARIHTPRDTGGPLRGKETDTMIVYDPGAIVIQNGVIEEIGPEKEILTRSDNAKTGNEFDRKIDMHKRCIIPGFVDPHTHLCFADTRETEFRMRLAGADYMQIHREGGGIMSSVRSLRDASEEQLLQRTLEGLRRSLTLGVTTVEVKTGYGLSTEAELRQLRVIREAAERIPQEVVPTFLGAHSIPEEYRDRREAFVELILEEMLPAAAETDIPRYCDIFTEEGVFTVTESERILARARELGMELKAHVDEIVDLDGAAMAARMGCVSAEHLIAANDDGLAAMKSAGTIAVVLPGTSFSLKKPFARAARMIEMGVPVALATDCNPGSCYTESIPFIVTLAVMQMGLSMEAALAAVTINAAYSIGVADRVGSLETGKLADFVVLDGVTPAIIPYHVGVDSIIEVYKRGELCSSRA